MLFCVVSHILKNQNAGLVNGKRGSHMKISKSNFLHKNLENITIVIENVFRFKSTLMCYEGPPSNYFSIFHTLSG